MKGYNSLKEVMSQYPIGYIVFPNTKPPLSIVGYFFDGVFYYPMYLDRFEGYQILEENE